MDYEELREILKKAIAVYGKDAQQDMVIEEVSELIKAICKIKRNKNNIAPELKENLYEEIADVLITLEQLIMIYDCDDVVEEYIEKKARRLKVRLEND